MDQKGSTMLKKEFQVRNGMEGVEVGPFVSHVKYLLQIDSSSIIHLHLLDMYIWYIIKNNNISFKNNNVLEIYQI